MLSILFLFYACSGDKEDVYYRLDRTNWFLYEEGDTLTFRNNSEAIDTYVIKNVNTLYYVQHDHIFYETLRVYYEAISECNNCPIEFFVRSLSKMSFSGDFHIVDSYYEDPTINYTLGDTILQDIYLIGDIATEDTNYFKVKALYYSDIYGIIRYDMYDDRVYELQLK
jgi:hypothetical protein